MPMHFRCPCGEAVFAGDGSAGKKGECPSCGKVLAVPSEAVVTGVAMPGRRAPAPSFDEEPGSLGAPLVIEIAETPATVEEALAPVGEPPPVIEVAETPVAVEEAPLIEVAETPVAAEEAPAPVEEAPLIEVEEAPVAAEEVSVELPSFLDVEEAPAEAAEEPAPLIEVEEAAAPLFELEEQPIELPPTVEAPAPAAEEIESLEGFPPVEEVPDLLGIEPRAPTEELGAPPPPPRRPPARKPTRRRPSAPREPARARKRPAPPAPRAERVARPSRAERPSRKSARRSSRRRGMVCRSCGMELRPGETMCPECGAKVGGSSAAAYVLVMIIIAILVAIAVVAYGAPEMLPREVSEPIRRVFAIVGLTVPAAQPSGGPETVVEEEASPRTDGE